MGFRFHKSFGVLPGLKFNLSKSGPSVSVGAPGATWNIGPRGNRATVGLPGSGISYTAQSSSGRRAGTGRKLWMALVFLAAMAMAVHENWPALAALLHVSW